MKKPMPEDIVRLKNEDPFRFYEVTGVAPNGGPVMLRDMMGNKMVEQKDIIVVTRRGNRYDYGIRGGKL